MNFEKREPAHRSRNSDRFNTRQHSDFRSSYSAASSQTRRRSYQQPYNRPHQRQNYRQPMRNNDWFSQRSKAVYNSRQNRMPRNFHEKNGHSNEYDIWYDRNIHQNVLYNGPQFIPNYGIPLANRFSILGNY